MTASRSYWMATAPAFAGTAGAPQATYDVVIVGAGFTGLTAARTLAKAGLDVAVFEQGSVGEGASGRNGGHLSNGLAHSYVDAVQSLGREGARELYHTYDASIDLIEEIIEDEVIKCGFRRSGKLKLASKPGHVAALRANGDLIREEADPDVTLLDKDSLTSEIRSDTVFAGLLYPKSAMMHMGAYVHGLATAVHRHGGQVFENCPVQHVQRSGGFWNITVPAGHIRATHLILAGGMNGAYLSDHIARQVLPIGSYVIATRPLTDAEIATTMPGDRTYVTSLNVGNYFRLAPDNRLIFGGRARFSTKADESAATRSVPILRKSLTNLFPSLASIEIDYAFGGLVDMSRDRFPRLGQTPDGAHYAIGLSGSGAQISALMGSALAKRILGEQPSDVFETMAPKPFPRGAIWTLPLIGAHARFKDFIS